MSILATAGPEQGFRFGDNITRRTDTVGNGNLFRLVISQRVVHVRGTPASGKSVLSKLLYNYILERHRQLTPIHMTWKLPDTEISPNRNWRSYLSE